MSNKIPNSVIGAVSAVIAAHYYSHTTLESIFMESGAPGDVPLGNCETKCSNWIKICNDDPDTDAFSVLGLVIQKYMDLPPDSYSKAGGDLTVREGQKRISDALSRSQLEYRTNGIITKSGSTTISKTLEDYIKLGDYSSIDNEFRRAVENIQTDPHASVTAACSIIESTLKHYIEKFNLPMPQKLTVAPLWSTVMPDLGLNSDPMLAADQHKVLKGMSSIIDGVAAFRSHIGSAHGRGPNPPMIVVAEARLVVNVSHTIVVFIMDILHAKKT
ncbi:abortive infection family protein [Erwinia sp. LJJL01]|uniref:abortive infection family protein n=1 Tax=Erwinia sp. LJJL01 TaxID=3391839 RepID=UPI00105C902E